ncbi:hypothetical protein DUZ99_19910 [Xylanibacillus composti]|uniref:Uncharacterized protein n=1 Tax=Xylanibacillus composti TaxID=1572762 RepID=A0A8J4M507_9BACL|nr:hypothetical protein [Xylanibacillus composti]GIQ71541.1 hypothetical protein XYCOK13_43650 [Xylanibacillus composti]
MMIWGIVNDENGNQEACKHAGITIRLSGFWLYRGFAGYERSRWEKVMNRILEWNLIGGLCEDLLTELALTQAFLFVPL